MHADLRKAVDQVEVLDVAGRLIADPNRAVCSRAAQIAMAYAVERMWEICLEADQLWRALERTMPWDHEADPEHLEHVALTAGHIRDLMAAITKPQANQQEQDDGSSHS